MLFTQDLRLLGQTKFGVYDGSGGLIDPSVPFQDCSSQSLSPEGGMESELAQVILQAQKRNVRHEATKVAETGSPFNSDDELQMFARQLADDLTSRSFPSGFNLNDEYGSLESYTTGRSAKPLVIPLPYKIWFPRTVVWCKALDLLNRIQLCRETI